MPETIGLLGGSFNPIHNGHLAMAEAAWEALGLDMMIIMPDGDPPHKSTELAPGADRLRMAELATGGRFTVSDMEITRPGKTYTIDTLRALRAAHPSGALFMLIGADTLHELPTWKDAEDVFGLCTFVVFPREDIPLVEIPGARCVYMKERVPAVSATQLRARVRAGYALEGYTPGLVEAYIGDMRLYDPPPLLGRAEMLARLKETLPPRRFTHTLGVEKAICVLAARWGYTEEAASLAGLLHDCAKGMSLAEMRALVDEAGVRVDAMRREHTALLHAPASMALARMAYGVTRHDVLHAIRYHNTGCARMETLDMLLYLADITEENRRAADWMEGLKALAARDLPGATAEAARIKLAHIQRRGQVAHPDTQAALNALTKKTKEEETL